MINKKYILLIIVLTIILLSGCTYGSYSSTRAVEISTSSQMSMSYEKFNGYKATSIKVKEGNPVDVNVDIVSNTGKLDMSITDEKDHSVYEGKDIPTSSFSVSLDKPGDYKLKVSGEKHSGSYKITWGKASEDNEK
ncbi:hypothetical protein [Clostridium sp. BNL1100]|uniref:hypothetical protein n=1 Tax=Clostridium sp. BNL1100 TaxID=755731 RepID=UPI00024A74F4|nr:hypothetical protein [Clostridium sp. BNL1100]AEY66436.1 hypothetical protein Clo1100_2261 [Clostridium sp. BNL1100]